MNVAIDASAVLNPEKVQVQLGRLEIAIHPLTAADAASTALLHPRLHRQGISFGDVSPSQWR